MDTSSPWYADWIALSAHLHWFDPDKGTLTKCLKFPSRKDTSYAGIVWSKGLLWMNYYSSHEDKTSIYLAKIHIPQAE
jgi:hypothetical protein